MVLMQRATNQGDKGENQRCQGSFDKRMIQDRLIQTLDAGYRRE